ncbi:MAG: DNA gyrase subunit A, partial [Bacteroidales bacterium]|nr:DNA gyrase subunit A [Bacteroidales bacterium]
CMAVADDGSETIGATEIPYMVNKKEMLERISQMVEDKKIEGISYINDETSREGVRVVFKLKMGANSNVVLNTLFKYTALQSSFAINNVALVGGRPRTLSLKDILREFIDFRHDVVVRRTKFELGKARERAHILEGLLKAIDIIDEIVALIKSSRTLEDARDSLISQFGFSEAQASAIVEMRLRQLVGMEKKKLQEELDELHKFIRRCEEILSSVEEQLKVVKQETEEMKEKYGDKRRTEIALSAEEFNPEDFYPDEDVVITISHLGYIKRTALTEFRTQNRGGVGMKGSATRDEDFVEHIYVANMHSTMLFFTDKGMCYRMKVYELPDCTRSSKGRAIQNLIPIEQGDAIKTYLNAAKIEDRDYTDSHYVLLVSRKGVIKKTRLTEYANSRSRNKGIIALTIKEGDALMDAVLTSGSDHIMIAARNGRCVHFLEEQARPLSRTAAGVRGISLVGNDEVIGVLALAPDSEQTVLVVSENGYGKRTAPSEYRQTSRGAKGVKTINITPKTGLLVAMKIVGDEDDLMIINKSGLTIRMAVSDIREAGRATQGVRLINIKENDSIAAVSVVSKEEEGETAPEETAQPVQQEEQQ